MVPTHHKKRKVEDISRPYTSSLAKKSRKQSHYASSSSPSADEFNPVDTADSDIEHASPNSSEARASATSHDPALDTNLDHASSASSSHDSDSEADSNNSSDDSSPSGSQLQHPSHTARHVPKRKDPVAFSTSLTTILNTKLPTSARADPVLSRSKTAKDASHSLAEGKLETKARRALREEKKKLGERGRVRDVVLGDRAPASGVATLAAGEGVDVYGEQQEGMSATQILEQERRLRKTAQRGVVKLFNAVRAAQVKGEEAAREARVKGMVGTKRREERVGEMGKKAFLELVSGGGTGPS